MLSKGKFELADKGTIFLDEIGEMPLSMQAKLLVFLQEKEIEPLGSQFSQPKKIDVRVIAATNQDLEKRISEGHFRQDLYFRLNVINLTLPPLRKRKDDIALLTGELFKKINRRLDTPINNIEPEVINLFCDYDWPGNVRELENFIEKTIIVANMEGYTSINVEHILKLINKLTLIPAAYPEIETPAQAGYNLPTMKTYLNLCEKRLIREALKDMKGDKNAVAKALDIHISALYKKINKYGLNKEESRSP